MSERLDDVFKQFHNVFLGREDEIKKFLLKYKKDAFIKQDVLNVERIDATDRLETSGYRENLSMWQNFYKNLIVSVCMEYKRKQKRFDYKFYFTEEKLDSELLEKVEEIIKEVKKLKARAKFTDALERLDMIEEMVADKQDTYFNVQLRDLRQEIKNAQEEYNKKLQKIKTLESTVEKEKQQQNFDKALDICKEIVTLAESIKQKQIQKKYEDLIQELTNEKIKGQINELNKKAEDARKSEKFKKATDSYNQIIKLADSAGLIEEKEKYNKKIYELNRATIEKEIHELDQKVDKNRESGRYFVAISNCNEIIELAESIDSDEIKEKTLQKIEEIKKESDQVKKREEIENKIAILEKQFAESKKNEKYEECLEITLEIIELASSIDDKESWKKYTQIKDDVIAKLEEKEKHKQKKVIEDKIRELEEKIEENRKSNNLEEIITISNKIIELSDSIERDDIKKQYQQLIEKIKKEVEEKRKKEEAKAIKHEKISELQKLIEERTQKKEKEQEDLFNKAKKFEDMIELEKNVMPIIEEYSVDEIIGDISDDVNQIIEQLNALLDEHRVEIKENITSESVLISTSGEIIELDDEIKVEKIEEEEETTFNVKSGFENPFDDIIEEAIITDLIPYNFEINNVEFNGEEVEELNNTLLLEDGLEVKWELKNINPKESVEIKYDLRKRISRTILFLLEDQVKIFKTHSKIKESKPKVEGLYDAKMPFKNSYDKALNGLVIEDIIPLYYVHTIREPTVYLPQENEINQGSLVKWNIGKLEPTKIKYHYKLLELYKLEELKALIYKLDKEGFSALKKDKIIESLEKYKEILKILKDFI